MRYIPSGRVPSDDLMLTDDDGEKYRPHEGEWVEFRRHLPIAVCQLMWGTISLEELEPEERIQRRLERGEEVVRALAHQILDWSWTDDFGKALPGPKEGERFAEALRWLAPYELEWLQDHVVVGGMTKNSKSP